MSIEGAAAWEADWIEAALVVAADAGACTCA